MSKRAQGQADIGLHVDGFSSDKQVEVHAASQLDERQPKDEQQPKTGQQSPATCATKGCVFFGTAEQKGYCSYCFHHPGESKEEKDTRLAEADKKLATTALLDNNMRLMNDDEASGVKNVVSLAATPIHCASLFVQAIRDAIRARSTYTLLLSTEQSLSIARAAFEKFGSSGDNDGYKILSNALVRYFVF